MTDRRIVITGIGAVSPLGNTAAETWEGMKQGRSGIARIASIDASAFPSQIAGEVRNYDPTPYFKSDPKAVRRCDRFEQLAMGAAVMAMEDAALDPEKEDKTRIGVMIGSGIGGLGIHSTNCETLIKSGPRRVSPFCIPCLLYTSPSP
ncbi:MAG TPA: beta-ketoacyl-[acyl-carrier-protein] synthase II, partial [Candidatus Akkermansia intestinigallinarum]|nr:beta-ketoacyl-[acyl-carrier-protein] synthase II [Candidatus Akkermansia intestinigallinarum]